MTALRGITVLELAESPGGEFCGKLLADFGATVIKIERPLRGSPTRSMGPFAGDVSDPETSTLFAYLNTNKQSVTLDLCAAEDAARLRAFLTQVDVVLDDHDQDWLEQTGIAPETVEQAFPGVVMCSITDYGLTPPQDRCVAQDINVFHSSGWGYHTPTDADPAKPPLNGAGQYLPGYEGAIEAALCIVAAINDRDHSGRGQAIEISKQEVLASRVDYVLAPMVAGEMPVGHERSAFDLAGPAGIFPCRDGFAYIWLSAPAHWEGVRQMLDDTAWMDDFPGDWLEKHCTPDRVAVCRQHIGAWLATQNKHDAAEKAQKLGVTLVAVNHPGDVLASAQYRFRGYFAELEHPRIGKATYPTVPYRLSATPVRLNSPAPLLGEHDEAMFSRCDGDSAGQNPRRIEAVTPAGDTARRGDIPTRGGPLQGVRVVELTKVWAGPYVGKLLAFLGAEVIRIESEGSLDVTRTYGVKDINNAPGFMSVNPEKMSAQINMKSEQGIEVLLDLIGKSDIVVENLRPGAIDRLGLGYERIRQVKPDIIYTSMGMWGNDGPLAYQTGYAPCFAALGGLTSLVGYRGEPPAGMNVRYADSTFGAMATYASLVALLHRNRTGEGQFIDVSAVECMTTMVGDAIMAYTVNGRIPTSDGNRHRQMSPHGVFPCADHEWLVIAIANDNQWAALAAAMGSAELAKDRRFADVAARKANEDELEALIAEFTRQKNAERLALELQSAGIAATKSLCSLDLIADHHLWARDFYHEVTAADGSQRPIVGPGWKMSRGATINRGAPQLGEHNRYIFGEVLGLSEAEQADLAAKGIIK